MFVKICGAEYKVPEASSLQELIESRNLSGKSVIIAVNDNIIRQELWSNTKLNPNDNVEIIRIVSGG
jgi:thiamine biosynthesis protein ThiS